MRKICFIFISLSFLILIQSSCSVKWTEAIQYGHVARNGFDETIDIQIKNNLIFTPVTIGGKEYLFLFDSGAPLSISEELQELYAFKTVSEGNIIDSDQNRKKVNWVKVDTIHIGNVPFVNQAAFVGDFKVNPILECLGIDGIIGSNLMRHCNWTLDQEKKHILLSDSINKASLNESITIPFKTDSQYNIFVNIEIGQALIKNIKLDYGSNGSIALPKDIFSMLKEREIISEPLIEKGVKQTGIIGKPINFSREICLSDSLIINNQRFNNIELKTGKSGLIGNKVLSRFIVTIDWGNRNLHLQKTKIASHPYEFYGFRIGYTEKKGVYIQSVIENSIVQKKGIRPNMKVTKLNSLDFENGNNFCDYVQLKSGDTISLELIDLEGQRQNYHINKTILSNK